MTFKSVVISILTYIQTREHYDAARKFPTYISDNAKHSVALNAAVRPPKRTCHVDSGCDNIDSKLTSRLPTGNCLRTNNINVSPFQNETHNKYPWQSTHSTSRKVALPVPWSCSRRSHAKRRTILRSQETQYLVHLDTPHS